MIEAESKPYCPMCGSFGKMHYKTLRDRLFNTSGSWTFFKCSSKNCKLLWLNPMPTIATIHNAYANYFTHSDYVANDIGRLKSLYHYIRSLYISNKFKYNSLIGWRQRLLGCLIYLFPRRVAEIDLEVFHLDAKNVGRLLEIGCGNGEKLKKMKALGWDVQGIDFDIKAVENARSKGLNVSLGSLDKFKFEENYFDAVVMSHVIEHVHDPIALVAECRRILKTGGRLVMVTPNSNSLGHKIFQSYWMSLDPPRHLILFNTQNIKKCVLGLGYSEVLCKTSIRDCDGVFATSTQILIHGYGKMGPHKKILSLYGKIAQLIEWLVMIFNKNIGEEIVLIAKK